MIDTHCHLTDPRLASQVEAVLSRAAGAGVRYLITIGTSIADSRSAVETARAHANVRCAVGVHPNYSAEADLAELPALREIQADPVVVALGEMGLDYHYDVPRDRQREAFTFQLQLAAELGRPVIIHCREAVDDCLAILRNFPGVRCDFHCFTGTLGEAEKILAAGHWLGFTGAITFKKNDELREVVRRTPIDRLLVETDAPYLTPEPMRKQKTNEPALVIHVARLVAQLKGVSEEAFDGLVEQNARRFFGEFPALA